MPTKSEYDEPWEAAEDDASEYKAVNDKAGCFIALFDYGWQRERAIACVNALDGVPDVDIENAPSLLARVEAAEAKVKELRAALPVPQAKGGET